MRRAPVLYSGTTGGVNRPTPRQPAKILTDRSVGSGFLNAVGQKRRPRQERSEKVVRWLRDSGTITAIRGRESVSEEENSRMRSFASRVVIGVACLSLWPMIASAQTSSIAGVVKDASGAVLPGVTVEAASPALIEKVRAVVADGGGQYKIINLVPGTYTVTFSL